MSKVKSDLLTLIVKLELQLSLALSVILCFFERVNKLYARIFSNRKRS